MIEKHENTYIKPRKCSKTQKTRKCLKNTKIPTLNQENAIKHKKHENA
jgi:hypothetical protein